jgi:hypothetical protein
MAPDDYVSAAGTLTFDPGQTNKTITVLVSGDTLNEINETFIITLRKSTNASISDAEAIATIPNDDPLPSLSVDDVSVTEGNSGVIDAVLPVTLSAASGQTVTVDYATVDGTASEHPGNDYNGISDTITFAPGETDDEVDVSVNGDTSVEANETFIVNLTNATNSTLLDAQGVATILDDDAAATPTPTPSASPTPTPAPGDTVQFSTANATVNESAGSITINVNRSGNTANPASVEYGTINATASERTDYTTSVGTLRFASGETSKSFIIFITDDAYVEGDEVFNVALSNPQGINLGTPATVNLTISDNDLAVTPLNPIDDVRFFVRQHYVDFLNREPDPSGFDFWSNQITACGANANCIANRRMNVSAAFFLSIEFQQTGYMVYLLQKASYGDMPRYRTFLGDTQEIGRGVVVGAAGWEAFLDANKNAFVDQWVNRPSFKSLYDGKSNTQFVDSLFTNAGITDLTQRNAMIAALQAGTTTRSAVLRQLTDNSEFSQKEFNSAFVLMQYFGYLRRNPDDAPDNNLDGFNFWLNKLNQFNGNYANAEMVQAFIVSLEYRRRFNN